LEEIKRDYEPYVKEGRWTVGLLDMWCPRAKYVKHSVHVRMYGVENRNKTQMDLALCSKCMRIVLLCIHLFVAVCADSMLGLLQNKPLFMERCSVWEKYEGMFLVWTS
jgi:hypothetical protein